MASRDRGRPIRQGPPLAKRVSDLERAHGEQRRAIGELKDLLNIKDNSAGELSTWIDKRVEVTLVSGKKHTGTLKWIDKYNYGVLMEDQDMRQEPPSIVPKNNVERVRLLDVRSETPEE